MQPRFKETAQKWREQKQRALQAMSEGAPELKTKALVETLDALRGSTLDRLVLDKHSRKWRRMQPLKKMQVPSSSQTYQQRRRHCHALSFGECEEPCYHIDYIFVGKLTHAGNFQAPSLPFCPL